MFNCQSRVNINFVQAPWQSVIKLNQSGLPILKLGRYPTQQLDDTPSSKIDSCLGFF